MPHASRRGILLGATLGLTVGTVGLVTLDRLDDSAAEREAAADRLAELAERWEHISPAQASAAALLTAQRLGAIDGADTAMLRARALTMYAQAQADDGRDYQAAQIAQYAKQTAAEASRQATPRSSMRVLAVEVRASAETIEGELYSQAAPRGDMAIEILASAGRRAGSSATAARAGALEAYARAVRGDGEAAVLDVLDRAEDIIGRQTAPGGWPHFTPGHLHAFGAAALIKAGATTTATEWLATADEELAAAGLPGIQVANTLYWAHGAAAVGNWDAAHNYAAGAVDAARARGIPAWLAGGVGTLARQAKGRGGDWAPLRAAVAAA